MKLKSKSFLISFLLVLSFVSFVPTLVWAQGTTTTPSQTTNFDPQKGLVPCGTSSTSADACTLYDVFTIFARVINFLLALAGLFAIFQIVRAGQSMVLAFGNPESLTTAKNSLTNAVLGLALVLIAFLLVMFVLSALNVKYKTNNPLGEPIEFLKKLQSDGGSSSTTTPPPGQGTTPGSGNTTTNQTTSSLTHKISFDCDGSAQGKGFDFGIVPKAHAQASCEDPTTKCTFAKTGDGTWVSTDGKGMVFESRGLGSSMTSDGHLPRWGVKVKFSSAATVIAEKTFYLNADEFQWELPNVGNGNYRITAEAYEEISISNGKTFTGPTVIVDSSRTLPFSLCTAAPTTSQPAGGGSYPASGRCLAEDSDQRGPREAACTPPDEFNPKLVQIDDYVDGVIIKDGNYIHPGAIEVIKNINNQLRQQVDPPTLRITEAYPPYAHHESTCHYNGRCMDISPFAGAIERKPEAIKAFITYCKALKAAGITSFLNETGLQETKSECGKPTTATFTNGAHIHVNLYK